MSDATKPAATIFTAVNNHVEDCGEPPPALRSDTPGTYVGYFQNEYGEQFTFECDRATGTARVRGGDMHWKDSYKVIEIAQEDLPTRVVAFMDAVRSKMSEAELAAKVVINSPHDLSARLMTNGNIVAVPGLNLSPPELAWVRACWEVTHRDRPVAKGG